MQIRNVRIRGKQGLFKADIENGVFGKILPEEKPQQTDQEQVPYFLGNSEDTLPDFTDGSEEIYDAKGRMMMPPFVEPHIHLDCVMTAGIPHYNIIQKLAASYRGGNQRARESCPSLHGWLRRTVR